MSENNKRSFYRGSAGWIIIGIIAAVAIILGVIMAFGSMLFPGGPGVQTQSETAVESATSGPGHNTTEGGSVPLENPEEEVATNASVPSTGQIPDSEVSFGRETSTMETPTAGQLRENNNSTNGTNDGLQNPLSENLTSLTGT